MTVKDFFKNDRFAEGAGIELLEVGNGTARARMEITPQHLNGGGVCQGGAIFTLADLAFAAAVNSHARLILSISSNIYFYKAESSGFLYADARETFNRGKISSIEVKVTNEAGDLIASFTGMGYNKGTELPFEPIT
ncbi:MAG: PaaI family thioesterase [Tannerella sp.]|jgi:acyl-CoA thioesterase|nr:PaaI family thioesterase [Tannerella sp.]